MRRDLDRPQLFDFSIRYYITHKMCRAALLCKLLAAPPASRADMRIIISQGTDPQPCGCFRSFGTNKEGPRPTSNRLRIRDSS